MQREFNILVFRGLALESPFQVQAVPKVKWPPGVASARIINRFIDEKPLFLAGDSRVRPCAFFSMFLVTRPRSF